MFIIKLQLTENISQSNDTSKKKFIKGCYSQIEVYYTHYVSQKRQINKNLFLWSLMPYICQKKLNFNLLFGFLPYQSFNIALKVIIFTNHHHHTLSPQPPFAITTQSSPQNIGSPHQHHLRSTLYILHLRPIIITIVHLLLFLFTTWKKNKMTKLT